MPARSSLAELTSSVSGLNEKILARARRRASSVVRFVKVKRGGCYVELDHNYKNSILVAGSGRGGTTWLAEILNHDNQFRDIFEPFFPARIKICQNFSNRQYLRPDNDDPLYLKPAEAILSGRLRDDWSDAYTRRIFCRKRLIKDIRVNLLLKWMHRHFPEMPLVLILRHPCAVVNSRLHLGWDSSLGDLLSQEALVADYLEPFMGKLSEAKDPFEKHLYLWCIENYVPLQQLSRKDALIVFYEDLHSQPGRELERLGRYLDLSFPDSVLNRVHRPSSQTRKRTSPIALGEDVLNSWKKHISDDMIKRAMGILELFQLSSIYGPSSKPLRDPDSILKAE